MWIYLPISNFIPLYRYIYMRYIMESVHASAYIYVVRNSLQLYYYS